MTDTAHPRFVYKFVGAQIEDGRDQGQEGAPRRGGGPRGRPLHHFLAPDGATYVLYIYFVKNVSAESPNRFSCMPSVSVLPAIRGSIEIDRLSDP